MSEAELDCLIFIEEVSQKTVAIIERADAEVPRAGEHVRFQTEGVDAEASYEVKRVTHHYGRRWESGPPSLLKVAVLVKK